jgi:hypothetical protein
MLYDNLVSNKLQSLHEFCNHVKLEISRKLEEEESHIKVDISGILEKLTQIKIEPPCNTVTLSAEPQNNNNDGGIEYKNVHRSADVTDDIAQV